MGWLLWATQSKPAVPRSEGVKRNELTAAIKKQATATRPIVSVLRSGIPLKAHDRQATERFKRPDEFAMAGFARRVR